VKGGGAHSSTEAGELRLAAERASLAWAALLKGSDTAVLLLASDGNICEASDAAATLLGRSVEALLHQPIAPLVSAHLAHRPEEPAVRDGTVRRPTGQQLPVRVRSLPLDDGCWLVLLRDLRPIPQPGGNSHPSRGQSLARLAAGIAHGVNTPLQVILQNATHLKELVDDHDTSPGELGPPVADVHVAAERIADLVRTLGAFSDGGPGEVDTVHPADFARDVLNLAAIDTPGPIHSQIIDHGAAPIRAYRAELADALLAVLRNARQAAATHGGSVTVEVAQTPDTGATITVIDNGLGIASDIAAHIFEPFFTTRAPGSGTGQGLALARAVVEDLHGGHISFRPEPLGGARFTLALPAMPLGIEDDTVPL
jgi:signal transduction histidine kinase